MIDFGHPLTAESILSALMSPGIYAFVCMKLNGVSFRPILAGAAIVGFLTSYVAFLCEVALHSSGAPSSFFGFLWLVALPEETVKLCALIGLARKSAGYPLMMLACFIGCGFAASENVVYLQRFGADVIAVRFLTATAFHVFNALIMARLFASTTIRDEHLRIVFALSIPVVLHASYDTLITASGYDGGRYVFVLCFTIAAGVSSLRATRKVNLIEGQSVQKSEVI